MNQEQFFEFGRRLGTINASSKDLASMTKSQIKEFGTSIGVSLNLSSSKANMISTLEASEEFTLSEVERKNQEMVTMSKQINGLL